MPLEAVIVGLTGGEEISSKDFSLPGVLGEGVPEPITGSVLLVFSFRGVEGPAIIE